MCGKAQAHEVALWLSPFWSWDCEFIFSVSSAFETVADDGRLLLLRKAKQPGMMEKRI